MALSIRMARGGRKGLPFYRIVVADKRMPRDGRFIEKLGTYNPLLANDDERRVILNEKRIKYWLSQGAVPSHRVHIFLGKAGIMDMPEIRETPKKSAPRTKTLEKIKEKEEKAKAPKEKAPAEEAKEEAKEEKPAKEAKAGKSDEAETPAEEAKEEQPREETKEEPKAEDKPEEKAEEPKAEEAPAEEAKTADAAPEAPAEEEKKEG